MVDSASVVDFATAAEQTLRDLRERVGLDGWIVARRRGDEQVVLAAVDDVFGFEAGTEVPWEDTFCARVLDGSAPAVAPRVSDVEAFVEARRRNGLDAGAVLAVPMVSSDGEVLGTLCAIGRREDVALADRMPTVRLQAGLLGTLLSHELRLADEVRRAERAERAAHTDPLTGVGNRRAWDAALAAEEDRAARYGVPVAVVAIDLDGLKRINDTAGHDVGDQLLRNAAAVLRERSRVVDVVARLGGDEFGLLLPETDREGAATVVAALRAALTAAGVAASCGIAVRRGSEGLAGAWHEADAAMYADKVRTRSRPGAGWSPPVPFPRTAPTPLGPAPRVTVDDLLRVAKDQLGADVAFVSTVVGDQRRFRNLVSTIDLPFASGHVEPLSGTYCELVADGRLPEVIADVAAHPVAADVPATRVIGIGSHVGVVLRRRDGRVYGSLCAFSRGADLTLRERDARVLSALAPVLMELVEAEDGG